MMSMHGDARGPLLGVVDTNQGDIPRWMRNQQKCPVCGNTQGHSRNSATSFPNAWARDPNRLQIRDLVRWILLAFFFLFFLFKFFSALRRHYTQITCHIEFQDTHGTGIVKQLMTFSVRGTPKVVLVQAEILYFSSNYLSLNYVNNLIILTTDCFAASVKLVLSSFPNVNHFHNPEKIQRRFD